MTNADIIYIIVTCLLSSYTLYKFKFLFEKENIELLQKYHELNEFESYHLVFKDIIIIENSKTGTKFITPKHTFILNPHYYINNMSKDEEIKIYYVRECKKYLNEIKKGK